MSWQKHLQESLNTTVLSARTFAAFNSNVDVVIRVRPADIEHMKEMSPQVVQVNPGVPDSPIETPEAFCSLLQECLAQGKSFYDVVDIKLSNWFTEVFAEKQEAMGGQAGIIANQMAALGAAARVYNPVLSQKQAELYNPAVEFPVREDGKITWRPITAAVDDEWTKLNFIFEYAKGETFHFPNGNITTPRANRIILGTRSRRAAMAFAETMEPHLPTMGAGIDVAFLAGYHHGRVEGRADDLDSFIQLSLRQLQLFRRDHTSMRLHLEYVPMRTVADEQRLLQALVPNFHSFGINENEITKVLEEFNYDKEARDISEDERAYTIYKGALALTRELQVNRVHVHNLGYYVIVLRKPYFVAPQDVREAGLYASAVNAVKAKQGGAVPAADLGQMLDVPLSAVGLQQLSDFAAAAAADKVSVPADFVDTGIFEGDDHYCLVVPAHIVSNPVSTVGMGDTVSSAAYTAEVSRSLE